MPNGAPLTFTVVIRNIVNRPLQPTVIVQVSRAQQVQMEIDLSELGQFAKEAVASVEFIESQGFSVP